MLNSPVVIISLAISTIASRLPYPNNLDDFQSTDFIVASLSASNHHGAPHPPEFAASKPGWYYGDDPGSADGLPWLKDHDLCATLAHTPRSLRCPSVVPKATKTIHRRSADPAPTPTPTPPTTPTYTTVFSGLTASIVGNTYITYGLVDTVADCQALCDTVSQCVFVNSYHDVNGQNGSPLLTCSLYASVYTAADATNYGGQYQPDGTYDYITDSDGYSLNT
ncbi:hypothetical protein DFJ43DRAFT_1156704 [Lentinula guzmanii]|uniref:Fruit-body specific protein a n=1 Tax=Lentinula guzmanii TaxID=2804957 RepID=A0AA38MY47_9AGAR|nr:hypothetical protein DFJ43DRAFT_1156704 [Lentinula guzmanii]KAJ3793045.1 hypothetical protein GGU11DRAFT_713091 [Lentinula aff. detonsa]